MEYHLFRYVLQYFYITIIYRVVLIVIYYLRINIVDIFLSVKMFFFFLNRQQNCSDFIIHMSNVNKYNASMYICQ